ncbi:winged helix-turn-helix domain-containing protein [Paenibacillus rhizophilus]|uniref:helix-turn-helix domain-containing protein n=1 Tax=Paenibacillus rhizophilus TaxID=1850366 RepID=UPI00319DE31E
MQYNLLTQPLTELLTHKRPVDVGFEAKYTWTLKLAIRYIEREFAHTFSERGLSLLLHRLGFSYTKATYTLARADQQEQKAFREKTLPALKKAHGRRNRSLTLRRRVHDSCVPIPAI